MAKLISLLLIATALSSCTSTGPAPGPPRISTFVQASEPLQDPNSGEMVRVLTYLVDLTSSRGEKGRQVGQSVRPLDSDEPIGVDICYTSLNSPSGFQLGSSYRLHVRPATGSNWGQAPSHYTSLEPSAQGLDIVTEIQNH